MTSATLTATPTAIVSKSCEDILTTLFDANETVKDCPLCAQPFGRLLPNGKRSKVFVACTPQRGVNLSEERRKCCLVCDDCIGEDGDGHILDKSGKCKCCVTVKNIEKRNALYAVNPAVEVVQATSIFSALENAHQENSYRIEQQDSQGQHEAMQAGIDARKTILEERAREQGFGSRQDQVDAREEEMSLGRDHSTETISQSRKRKSPVSEEKRAEQLNKARDRYTTFKKALADLDEVTDGLVKKQTDLHKLIPFIKELQKNNKISITLHSCGKMSGKNGN